MDTATIQHDVETALDKLASKGSPRQIADHLLAGGHRGERGCPDRCSVAVYVITVVPGADDDDFTVGVDTWCSASVAYAEQAMPPGVQEFIKSFDRAEFPELQRV